MEDQIASSNAIVAEIIDCWFELRAIKDLLTEEEVKIAALEKPQTPEGSFNWLSAGDQVKIWKPALAN